ncbi:30S ribosomal protein S9 [bacterium (Candidatus Howlettbacteria) CG_4_10_14_0_8_um_filter_40_9]|nr:MAG: 30S ribosomal protein S9 [bacterium (Candidatus Howlettbacteria) CG_4_10_14_0_8_um_filter_40_9]
MTDTKETTEEKALEDQEAKDQGFSGKYSYGRGRRKEASARVRLYKGNGKVVINGKEGLEYFNGFQAIYDGIFAPLKLAGYVDQYDISVKIEGGGKAGQAGAIKLGVARALLEINAELRPTLRKGGFLTRDSREKERKKPGLKRARKAPQFSKR